MAARRHLGAGAALSVVVQGGPLLAGAVLSIVLARTLGPSGNGHFALLVTLTGITALVASLGLAAGITFEVSRRRWSVRGAFLSAYALGLALGLAGAVAALAVFLLLRDSVFEGIDVGVAVVAFASLPAVLAYGYAYAILLARERYEGYAALELTHAAALVVVGASLAIPFELAGAVVGLPAAAVAGAAVGAVLLGREARRDHARDEPGALRRATRFGLQSWGANLLQQVNYRFDIVVLGGFAAAADVGVYSVALTLTGIAWVLPQALQTVLFPRVASLAESTSAGEIAPGEADAVLGKAVRHGVLLSVPSGVIVSGLLLAGVPLLYGDAFSQTIPLGFVLLPGVLLLGIGKILTSVVTGRGYPKYTLYAGAVTTPVTLALYLALIPPFAAWGAAVASSLSYAFTTVLAVLFFRRVTSVGFRDAFLPRLEDVADYGGLWRVARAWRLGQ